MKQLSIEEKAKAYDEAIEKAKTLYENANGMILKKWVEQVFPELKESEDERIRKELIDFLEYYRLNNVLDSKTISLLTDSVAWLEKQGKNNMGISEATKRKLEDNLNKALEQETPESWNEFLEKQGEQKPAWSEEDRQMKMKVLKYLLTRCNVFEYEEVENWFKSLKDRVQPQLKQEWSDVDKDILFRTIDNLKFLRDTISIDPKYAVNIIDIEREIDFLKNLKDRVRPKQEWSEEDEKEVAVLEAYIRSRDWSERHIDRALSIVDELVKKLKSIRPQNTQKPSGFYLECISDAIALYETHGINAIGLKEILEELKKLREE